MTDFITEEEAEKYQPVEPAQPAGVGPEPNANPYLTGSISPVLQHDSNLVATQYKRGSGVPVFPLMPASPGSSAQANAGSSGIAKTLIKPVQTQVNQNAAAIAALQQTSFQGAWDATTSYSAGAQVDFSGIIYTSLVDSNLNNEPDISPTFWQSVGASEFLGNWSAVVNYVPGDQVIDAAGGGGYYICTVANLNAQPSTHPADWQLITAGNVNSFAGAWNSGTAYTIGQTVTYQGSLWVSITAGTNNTPSLTSSFWTLLGSNGAFQGTWSSSTAYTQNMTVAYQGNLYQAVQASTNQTPSPTSTTYWILTGPSTLDNLVDGSVYIKGVGVEAAASLSIQNNSFEASSSILPPPGWGKDGVAGTVAYLTVGPQSGNQSLSLRSQGGGIQGEINTNARYACQPGDAFYVSGYVKSDGTGIAQLGLNFYNASGTFEGSILTTGYTGTSWSFVTASGVAPANAVYCQGICFNADSTMAFAYFDNINAWKVTNLGSTVGDGPANFSAQASGLAYLPLSNPLSATGTTITISSFTLRTSAQGDISLGSGSIGSLTAGQTYYVYFDFTNGVVQNGTYTFNATTTRGTAVSGGPRIFVGSVQIPQSGSGGTNIGFGDGGFGVVQTANTVLYVDTQTLNSLGSPSNVGNEKDGSFTSSVNFISSTTTHTSSIQFANFSSPRPVGTPTSLTLYVNSKAAFIGAGACLLQYSIDGGSTFTTIYSTNANRSQQTDSISLSATQDLSQVQIFVSSTWSSGGTVTINLYETWVQATY